ncbi:hypothetical protein WICPIJ_009891, partial [Wickerhamomyces pijperi]
CAEESCDCRVSDWDCKEINSNFLDSISEFNFSDRSSPLLNLSRRDLVVWKFAKSFNSSILVECSCFRVSNLVSLLVIRYVYSLEPKVCVKTINTGNSKIMRYSAICNSVRSFIMTRYANVEKITKLDQLYKQASARDMDINTTPPSHKETTDTLATTMEISFRPRYTASRDPTSPINTNSSPYSSTTKSGFKPRKNVMSSLTSPASLLKKLHVKALLISLLVWLLWINHNERTVVHSTLSKCQWDKWDSNFSQQTHKVALLADPQIMDDYSYPGRPRIINAFIRRIIDNYHKRNWEYIKHVIDPDSTFFLGDLFDGGRNWEDKDWLEEYQRFHSIYSVKTDRRTVFSLPGNHDIGFGETVEVDSWRRFRGYFGETSSVHDVGNHTIVILDTISLSDYQNEEVTTPTRKLLERLNTEDNGNPRIILTHVPFYRFPDQQTCGPLRESTKKFPIMKGLQYQTVIDHQLTQEILAKVHPEIIFAGDDHDYCHIEHDYLTNGTPKKAEEITVKSCSMNMGIQYPAIQLLSLNTGYKDQKDGGGKTFKTQICYLPAPYQSGLNYLYLLLLNLAAFVWVFIFPESFQFVYAKAGALISRKKDYLPIASVNVKSAAGQDGKNSDKGKRDFVALVVNCFVGTVGIFSIFSVFYNAFY